MAKRAEELKELLVVPGLIKEADFAVAVTDSEASGRDLVEVLVDHDLIKDEQLGKLLAESLNSRFLDIAQEKVEPEVLMMIPEMVAREFGAVALSKSESGVKVGMVDPNNVEARHAIEKRLGESINIFYITPRGLKEALQNYRGGIKDELLALVAKLSTTLTKDEQNEVAVKTVDAILQYGYQSRASDIHLEPSREKILLRFRIDGVMHDMLTLPVALEETLVSRIKVMARLRIDEHMTAQDGKLQFASQNNPIDVRVSILPVTTGENVVMRILSEESRRFTLTDLGLREGDMAKVKSAIDNPHGMILVTGPTGSGKTTTVYAVMKILNTREVHISTIEDPVEYEIKGVSQIQVNTKANLTFASGLRSIVRQDPDIIMVGEIRDEETASIAVNSAMTGHLVLSTLHANDAPTTLPRLLDMKVEPFLVASTVNVVIAQRLVRKICSRCRESYEISDEEKRLIDHDEHLKKIFVGNGYKKLEGITFYKGAGCDVCNHTGFNGRMGIFEVLEMTEKIKELVVARASSGEVLKVAESEGMTTMLEDGITKALDGTTTLQEVLRVIRV